MKNNDFTKKDLVLCLVSLALLLILIGCLLAGIYLLISGLNLETPSTPDWKQFGDDGKSINPAWIQYHHQYSMRIGFGSVLIAIPSFLLLLFLIGLGIAFTDDE